MILKKLVIGIIFCAGFYGCTQHVILLGPAYTLAKSGNIYQAGLSFGSDQAITKLTGKSTGENIKQMLIPKKRTQNLYLMERVKKIEPSTYFRN
jgi:hypothetical protein|tara:strand:- start:88 stop:369 length:282 start_codon:yes stop_codon:yes gene_type:complete